MSQAIRAIYETEHEATPAVLGDALVPVPSSADDDFDDLEAMRLIREELHPAGYPNASQSIIEERREGP